jgi:hypothetical protein
MAARTKFNEETLPRRCGWFGTGWLIGVSLRRSAAVRSGRC